MPSVYQHILPFRGDAFGIFTIFKDQPQAFFLDSSLRQPHAQFSYIGFAPFATVKGRDWVGFKRVFDKYRLTAQGLPFPAGAVGCLGYDGSLFFGFYDTIMSVDHQKHCLVISSLSQARIKDILKQLKAYERVLSGGRGRGIPSERRLLRARWGNPRTGPAGLGENKWTSISVKCLSISGKTLNVRGL